MDRPSIPASVMQELRQEVNYGCPVPDCGIPLLSFHHFDPPWHKHQHNNPAGMIALCPIHHGMGDSGAFPNASLRQFKKSPNNKEKIEAKFSWIARRSIIRLGGCYAADWCKINIGPLSVLDISYNQDGNLSLSFCLSNHTGELLATMKNNCFVGDINAIHDLKITASANRIKIWHEKNKPGFELCFSRVTPQELEEFLEEDSKPPQKPPDPRIKPESMIPEPIPDLSQFYDQLRRITDVKQALPVGFQRNDIPGTLVRWHAARHLEDDGKIPLFNCINGRFYEDSCRVEFRNGRLFVKYPEGELKTSFCFGHQLSFPMFSKGLKKFVSCVSI